MLDVLMRSRARLFACFDVRELLAADLHGDERVKVEVGLDSSRVGLFFSNGSLSLGRLDRKRRYECERQDRRPKQGKKGSY